MGTCHVECPNLVMFRIINHDDVTIACEYHRPLFHPSRKVMLKVSLVCLLLLGHQIILMCFAWHNRKVFNLLSITIILY